MTMYIWEKEKPWVKTKDITSKWNWKSFFMSKYFCEMHFSCDAHPLQWKQWYAIISIYLFICLNLSFFLCLLFFIVNFIFYWISVAIRIRGISERQRSAKTERRNKKKWVNCLRVYLPRTVFDLFDLSTTRYNTINILKWIFGNSLW